MKRCTDPTFLDTAVYATVGGKLFKLSRLVAAWDEQGTVEFETLNNQYEAKFTDAETRRRAAHSLILAARSGG